MAICTEACCNGAKREEAQFYARLGFARAMAQSRGQTVDRVVPAEPMVGVLLRPNEPENIKSESIVAFAPRCECTCPCDNIKTVRYPTTCRECQSGKHVKAA